MPDWQERITRDTPPAIRVEHELRYAAAAPLIRASEAWCDLGCGNGLGAAAALGGSYDGAALLVDVDAASVERAAGAIAAREVVGIAADLTDPAELERVRAALLGAAPEGARCITCFETIEHLGSFAPLVAMLVELAETERCSVVASVPNDAFWAIQNPHHATTWGEGAVAELRSLLPSDHLLAHQVPLQGSALVREGASAEEVASVALGDGVPSHFLLAFGPGVEALATAPRVVQAELEEQRRWERQRESDLRYAQDAVQQLAEFRAYIHELERRLGLPPSGAPDDAA